MVQIWSVAVITCRHLNIWVTASVLMKKTKKIFIQNPERLFEPSREKNNKYSFYLFHFVSVQMSADVLTSETKPG